MKRGKEFDGFRRNISFGIMFGAVVFVFTLIDKLIFQMPQVLGIFLDLYGHCGYDRTYFGSILGLVYGFITGFVLSAVYGWFRERV